VFTDATLTRSPSSARERRRARRDPGIGQTKLDKFGEEVLTLVGATATV
jgi:hypothetical protein